MESKDQFGSSSIPSWRSPFTSKDPGLYFRDGQRMIDFVLVYSSSDPSPTNASTRIAFLRGLAHEMIEIEVEDSYGRILGCTASSPPGDKLVHPTRATPITRAPYPTQPEGIHRVSPASSPKQEKPDVQPSSMDRYRVQATQDPERRKTIMADDLVFVKLHAPWHVMCAYAEKFSFRKQLKTKEPDRQPSSKSSKCGCTCSSTEETFPPLRTTLTWPFNGRREHLFDIPPNRDEFFTPVERALVVDYILRRGRLKTTDPSAKTSNNDDDDGDREDESSGRTPIVGITRLLSENVFLAAYPLHEPSKAAMASPEFNNRSMLRRYWATFRRFCQPQPLDYIRYYFGEAVAFYFAWLGFYTLALLPVAILGVLVFLFGLVDMRTSPIQDEVCNHGSGVIMCPLCSLKKCKFWTLNRSCLRTKLTSLVDNEGTVLFGIVMALWAIIFLELWKRRQFACAYRWNVSTLEPVDQPARPEYLALLDKGYKKQYNPISENEEPVVPLWSDRLPSTVCSFTIVLFSVVLTLACLIGVILYKIVIKVVFYQQGNPTIQSMAGILTTITSAVINLILILLLQMVYNRIAIRLTDMEKHRTQVQYDNSLTLKLYMLQFVNHYASIFYIAFVQGTTAALPGSDHPIIQSTGCDEDDCLFELFIQLIVFMVGKQLLSFVREMTMPWLLRMLHTCRHRRKMSSQAAQRAAQIEAVDSASTSAQGVPLAAHLVPCRSDFDLLNPGSRMLFDEYLEMMIQFGFITMFVPAFPLAPFFGLLNNLFELRGDAKKFVNQYRRPVVDRVKTIGIWYSILLVLSSIAIRTNACLIAFTTQFIDRWVYRMHYNPDHNMTGFKNFTLSVMPSSRFNVTAPAPTCHYVDYRKPPWEDENLSHTLVFYHVLAAKFIFVFIFETLAILLTSLVASAIPDVPQRIKTQIYREMSETSKIIFQAELGSRGKSPGESQSTRDEVKRDGLRQMDHADREELPSMFFFSVPEGNDELGFSTLTPPLHLETREPGENSPLIGFRQFF